MTHELRSKLPAGALELLDCEDSRYSEWATASALAMYALNAGMDENEFVELVSMSDFAADFATENGRDRSGRLENRLRKVWHKAEDDWNLPIGGVANVRTRIAELSQRLNEYPWSGRTGSTDRRVSLSVVGKAHEVGVWTLDLAERDLSLRAGVARATAGKSLGRLTGMEILSKDSSTHRTERQAQRWVLNLDWGITHTTSPYKPLPPRENSCGLVMNLNHPVFLRAALGQTAERVWVDLAEHPASKAGAVAARLGVSAATVRRTLEALIRNRLVVKAATESAGRGRPSAVYSVDPAGVGRLDQIAAEYGVTDWEERTAQRYEAERHGFDVLRQQGQQPADVA